MDMERRQRLIDKTMTLIEESVLPAVPMDEFFEGNTYDRSMGRGIQTSRDTPISEYHEVFRSIRNRPDVQEVFVVINELPGDQFPEERKRWPNAFVVNIITSAPVSEVENWIEQLEPRGVGECWAYPTSGVKPPLSDQPVLRTIELTR